MHINSSPMTWIPYMGSSHVRTGVGAPCTVPNADDEEDDGFILFSQAEYIRGSQAVGTPNMTPREDTQVRLGIHNMTRRMR